MREPGHRAFGNEADDWDIERIIGVLAAVARMRATFGLFSPEGFFAPTRAACTLRKPGGRFPLCRIGDAVAERNIHAGAHDALRYGSCW